MVSGVRLFLGVAFSLMSVSAWAERPIFYCETDRFLGEDLEVLVRGAILSTSEVDKMDLVINKEKKTSPARLKGRVHVVRGQVNSNLLKYSLPKSAYTVLLPKDLGARNEFGAFLQFKDSEWERLSCSIEQ